MGGGFYVPAFEAINNSRVGGVETMPVSPEWKPKESGGPMVD